MSKSLIKERGNLKMFCTASISIVSFSTLITENSCVLGSSALRRWHFCMAYDVVTEMTA